ncbi:unnamed protein product [Alternaria alternata]|nr:unnamed protein product [Alternaria burnsii]
MQLTKYLSVLAFVPFLAVANPLAVEDVSSVNRFPLEARGGIDFCGSDLRAAGDSCTFGGGESDPHACGIKDRAVVLYCVNGKWAINHRCAQGQQCMCDKGTPKRGNLVCR